MTDAETRGCELEARGGPHCTMRIDFRHPPAEFMRRPDFPPFRRDEASCYLLPARRTHAELRLCAFFFLLRFSSFYFALLFGRAF